MGKTSLLARGLQQARETGAKVVLTDLQKLNAAHLESAEALCQRLAEWIAEHGHEAEHLSQVGLLAAKDPAIWEYALSRGSAVVTKDEDFPRRRAMADPPPKPGRLGRFVSQRSEHRPEIPNWLP